MSFRGDERAEMGGRAAGEMRGSGRFLTRSSLALQRDPALISADCIRHCLVLSALFLCGLSQGGVRHDLRSRDPHITRWQESMTCCLWDQKAGAVCLFDCCDFHSPGPAGGQNDGRLTDSGPLSVQCLHESGLLPTRPRGTGPVNIWCLLWMAWSEVFVVIKNQTNRTQQKKILDSMSF